LDHHQPIFSDLKVLELASVLAGPGVGQFFAEAGAEVIKVENAATNGDVTRTWKSSGEKTDDRSAYFCSVNWGKKSIAIDLTQPEGLQIIYELVREIDIVISSFKTGDALKLGVDYQRLSEKNPRLIYGQISGYGEHNPRVGYDAVIQAESGFMFMNGEPGGASLKMPVALIDVLASHQLKEGLLLALIKRYRTHTGALVEVSLMQSAVASLVNQATNWLIGEKLPIKMGSSHPNIAPYGDLFKTADDREFLLAVGDNRQFQALCTVLNLDDVKYDRSFNNNERRVANRAQLHSKIARRIKLFKAVELQRLLTAARVPSGIVNNLKEVFETSEAQDILVESGGLRSVLSYVGSNRVRQINSHFLPPPHLGEHSREILAKNLNYAPRIIQNLFEKKVVR
jgi:crotonobetainyl-CoA:carnitine CoA-transferase CaiB-like acyl-CoA transferase